MKIKTTSLYLSIAFTALFITSSPADSQGDDPDRQREANRQRYDLIDQEKYLLKESDDLSYQVMDLKRNINDLQKRLSLAQSKLDEVRYNLVSVRMKLMP